LDCHAVESLVVHLATQQNEDEMIKIGFVGSGQMARALGGGIAGAAASSDALAGGDSAPEKYSFFVSDPNAEAIDSFREAIGESAPVAQLESNASVFAETEVIFLAVKPQYFDEALDPEELRKVVSQQTGNERLVISIVAGVPITKIEARTSISQIVRTMPNTPCLIGAGAIGLSCSSSVTETQRQLAIDLLSSTGTVFPVDENLLDVVTGLSGSGPGYVFEFIESLTSGGVNNGLPRELAQQMAIETVLGAAKLAKVSGEEPTSLRDRVTSPGGTTLAGLNALKKSDFRTTIGSAVDAATARSIELRAQ
jgi:pyrroline-5-carboxylate reductase